MPDLRKDLRKVHRRHLLPVSYHPGSTHPAAAGLVGSTSAVAAARTVLQEARSQDRPAGRGWASCRSSRCCWAGPAGMAARRLGCRGQHRGGWVAVTEGIAAVRPGVGVSG
jgi:hypothetical protein